MVRTTLYSCVLILAIAACGKKGDSESGKTVEQKTPDPTPLAPVTCAKGQIADNGNCVALPVTPQKIDAIKKSADRLAEIDALLDNVEAVAGPIELLNAFRQLDAWKQMAAANGKLAEIEKVVVLLDTSVKQLRTLRTTVAASRVKLTDLTGTMQKAYDDSGAAGTLADLRARVSADLTAALAPLEAEVSATVQKALIPALAELTKVEELLDAACAIAKVSGGGDQVKDMCKQSEEVFGKALAYLKGLEGKPIVFFTTLVTELDAQVGDLVSAEVKAILTDADARLKSHLAPPASP